MPVLGAKHHPHTGKDTCPCYLGLHSCPDRIGFVGAQLTCLNLSNNRLHQLPEDIGCLRGLRDLYIQYNCLEELPVSIGNLTKLTDLDCKNNSLRTIPLTVGNLTALTCLNVTNNVLQRLPAELGRLAELEEICAHSNQLVELPDELCNLTNLTELYLGENRLQQLPRDIGRLVRLEELDVSSCELTHLPDSLSRCTALVRLWLSNNRLRYLPDQLGRLHHLKELHVRNNDIMYFPASLAYLQLYTFSGVRSTSQHPSPTCSSTPSRFNVSPRLPGVRSTSQPPSPTCSSTPSRLLLRWAIIAFHLPLSCAACCAPSHSQPITARSLSTVFLQYLHPAANQNPLIEEWDNRLTSALIRVPSDPLPSLLELAARTVARQSITWGKGDLPLDLEVLLQCRKQCSSCEGPFFSYFSSQVFFSNVGMFHRVPLYQQVCSPYINAHCQPIGGLAAGCPYTSRSALPTSTPTANPYMPDRVAHYRVPLYQQVCSPYINTPTANPYMPDRVAHYRVPLYQQVCSPYINTPTANLYMPDRLTLHQCPLPTRTCQIGGLAAGCPYTSRSALPTSTPTANPYMPDRLTLHQCPLPTHTCQIDSPYINAHCQPVHAR
ncbi:hypothetical protein Bbelb_166880 [Branchiostoma belcheri]|nr:hypothetical protein Bbelb_166880 [Branchiostoma belcheri]